MRKLIIAFGIVVLIFIVSFCIQIPRKVCTADIGNKKWNIQIARTPEERAIGLMNRTSLCKTCGMLFVFDDMAPRNFWMKNTLIPLDMYFYDSRGELVDMAQDMRPESETEYPMDYTSQPAQFVMEVNAGTQLFDPEKFDPRECVERVGFI